MLWRADPQSFYRCFIVIVSAWIKLNKFLLVLNQFWGLIMKIFNALFFNPIHLINHHLLTHVTWIFRLSDKQGRSGSDPAANKLDPQDVKFRRLFVGNLDKEWDESVIQDTLAPSEILRYLVLYQFQINQFFSH